MNYQEYKKNKDAFAPDLLELAEELHQLKLIYDAQIMGLESSIIRLKSMYLDECAFPLGATVEAVVEPINSSDMFQPSKCTVAARNLEVDGSVFYTLRDWDGEVFYAKQEQGSTTLRYVSHKEFISRADGMRQKE
jgi:hypothetical protein